MRREAPPRPYSGGQRWTLADIPYDGVRRDRVAESGEFFQLVASASFIESASALYTQNLVDFFRGDEEVTAWLEGSWLREELQHGRALRAYVEAAWPDFDWQGAYEPFHDEFVAICEKDGLEDRRSLEMASRCVVETGTAVYYTTLSRASPEPVLALLARHIAEDEVRHYKHFYRYYRKYRALERPRRRAVAGALWRRLRMTKKGDTFTAAKHVHEARGAAAFDEAAFADLLDRCRAAVGPHFPYEMSVKMLLKPLELGPGATRLAVPVATALARRLVP